MNAVRRNNDLQRAVCFFVEVGPFGLVVLVLCVRIGEGNFACAQDLETIVEVRSSGEILSAEARARVVHFEQQNRLAGVVADRCLNAVRMTPGEGEKAGKERRDAKGSHNLKITGTADNRHGLVKSQASQE